MEALNVRERSLAGLARSARAGLVVPALFALALFGIKQPEMAGPAVFGTFAHLVLTNYDPAGNARFAQSALLTLLGAVAIAIGTLASESVWLAVGGAAVVSILAELPPLAGGRLAPIRKALLLAFMLAVAVPAPAGSVFPYLAGWLIAGVLAQPALLLIWISLEGSSGAGESESCRGSAANGVAPLDRPNWTGNAVRSGLALGFAVLLTRVLKVEHAFWVVLGVIPVLSAGAGSAARTFWKEQAGTLAGFLLGAVLVAAMGSHQAWYWLLLPFVVFGSAYLASAVGFMPGQAAFTLFAIVLFCILSPQQTNAGIFRLEDIAIGGAVSLVVSSLLRLRERGSADHLPSAAKA